MSAESPYDALAPHYREYAKTRADYLNAVDEFILRRVPPGARSLLDVGAGDGVRGMALAKRLKMGYVVLCDNSAQMAARCRELGPNEVWETAAEELPDTDRRFDVIVCLWNTLGHLAGRAQRVKALAGMRRLLGENGAILLDVNNRHNAASYGWLKVFSRILVDAVCFDEKRGNATFDWRIGDRTYRGSGHLFTPREIESTFAESGLRIREKCSIDYRTGAASSSTLRGQLVYSVAPDTGRAGMARDNEGEP